MTEDDGEGEGEEEDGLFRELLHEAQEQPVDISELLDDRRAERAREGARRLLTPPPTRNRNRDRSRDRDRERNRNRRNDNYRCSDCATLLFPVAYQWDR